MDNKEYGLADLETANNILWVAKRDNYGWLDVGDIENFPSQDLGTINQLWLAASKGKFGFTVQKQIWMDLGGKPGQYDNSVFNRFIEKVEWAENKAICFDQRAAKGHLPLGMYVKVDGHMEKIHNRWWVEINKIRIKELEKKQEEIKEKEQEIKRLKEMIKHLMEEGGHIYGRPRFLGELLCCGIDADYWYDVEYYTRYYPFLLSREDL